jgi:hypothetical protein
LTLWLGPGVVVLALAPTFGYYGTVCLLWFCLALHLLTVSLWLWLLCLVTGAVCCIVYTVLLCVMHRHDPGFMCVRGHGDGGMPRGHAPWGTLGTSGCPAVPPVLHPHLYHPHHRLPQPLLHRALLEIMGLPDDELMGLPALPQHASSAPLCCSLWLRSPQAHARPLAWAWPWAWAGSPGRQGVWRQRPLGLWGAVGATGPLWALLNLCEPVWPDAMLGPQWLDLCVDCRGARGLHGALIPGPVAH